jgi:isoleucyl-tRNA synthetase
MKKAPKPEFPQFEAEMLQVWEEEETFKASLDQRKGSKRFSFYDGPPFANGLPHYGHALASTEKDAIVRYKTMQGYYVPRRAGWDTHGLPVEYEVEKQLGLSGKRQILDLGVDKFNQACRDSVFKYRGEWEQFIRRIGRWIDLENAYATLDDSYIESVWWVFKSLWGKDLIYQGFKSLPYCPRCATPLSNFELNQGYQDGVEDPSVYVKFELSDSPGTYLLAWTTTPWTLPANAALAVKLEAEYVEVDLKGERMILAKSRLELFGDDDFKVVRTMKGSELLGLKYNPLYTFTKLSEQEEERVNRVYEDEAVSLEDGTGILHVAPAYGETDLELGQREGLPLIHSVDGFGKMTEEMGEFAGKFFKEADEDIIADLTKRNQLYAAGTFTHTYPFCWRCDSPLMYFATPSWFVKVTELVDKLVKNNQKINWIPAHIKDGRFGNWLAEARDWSISRNRFWGAPIPVWRCGEEHYTVVGSLDELRSLSGHEGQFDMHPPGIDEVTIKCPQCQKEAKRVEQVFDCWFESGSMPYAEDHYPFENKDAFKEKFPADFIAEGLDQTRGWFYTLHVLATALFDEPAFKNVIVNGIVVAADGKKLSKRLKNYPDISEIFDRFGADSLRYFLVSSPVVAGEDARFSQEVVEEVFRNVFMTWWNVYSFLSTYAEVDGWQPPKQLVEPKSEHVLDRWLLSRLNETIEAVTAGADNYEIARATRPLRDLIDDLSNWYVRRSRRRFWKSENDADKEQAYATLHFVMVRITQLMAPWAPFLPDKIYRGLTEGMEMPSSVHLTDWPKVGEIDDQLLEQMNSVRQVVTEGLSQRATAGIKVRQPLPAITGPELSAELVEIVKEEVNVKAYTTGEGVKLDTNLTKELKQEGVARDVIRLIQQRRKEAGLEVDDRITLKLFTDGLSEALEVHKDMIMQETLATELKLEKEKLEGVPARVDGQDVYIELAKI